MEVKKILIEAKSNIGGSRVDYNCSNQKYAQKLWDMITEFQEKAEKLWSEINKKDKE